MAVTDNLGRDISAGIDGSSFLKEMADSLRKTDIVLTKTSDSTEQIASGSGKLPQEIADKVYAAFEKDIGRAVDYLGDIKKFCDDKAKGSGGGGGDGSKGMIDAITTLGDNLMKHFASGGAEGTGVAAGFTTANAHLAAIAGSTSATATACSAMAAAFLHKGSGYTHDIHCEAILAAMQQDIRQIGAAMGSGGPATFDADIGNIIPDDWIKSVKAIGPPALPGGGGGGAAAAAAGAGGGGDPAAAAGAAAAAAATAASTDDILAAGNDIGKQYKNLNKLLKKIRDQWNVTETEVSDYVDQMQRGNFMSADQVRDLNLMLDRWGLLTKQQQIAIANDLRGIKLNGVNNDTVGKLLGTTEKIVKATENVHKNFSNIGRALESDVLGRSEQLVRATVNGAAGGIQFGKVMEGIWGGQIEHNKNLHEALYITQGLNAGLDRERQLFMKLGREASAVAETGANMLEYQKAYRENMKLGIKDAQTLSRITRAGASLASATGMDVAQTAQMFGQWNVQLGLSSNQMSQVGRAAKFAAQATGLMGNELAAALQSAKELANEMRNAGTLTADAAGAYMQMAAATKKYGVEKSMNPLLKALSSTVSLYNEASNQTKALLFQAASSVGRSRDLQNGEVMNSEAGRKDMGKGMENVLNSFLKQFGKDMSQIDQLTADQKFQLNLQLQSAYGMQLGEFQRTVEAYKEGTKSVTDRINDINKKLQGNLTQQERQALLDQKRGMELQKSLEGLTKLDEAAKSAKTMAEALGKSNMTEADLRKQLTDSITNVNGALAKAGKKGDMIDPRQIEAALKDPTQYRELLSGINAAEQKAQVAAKAAADPVLAAQQKMNELQGKVIENTGKIAERMTSFLGPRGVIAMSLLALALQTQTGQALLTQSITKLMAARGVGGAGAAAAGGGRAAAGAAATGGSAMLGNATAAVGTQAATAAPLMTRFGASISAFGAALLPLIKVVAVVGLVILALVAIVQGLQKAFQNIGFDMGELSAIGGKVWEIIKKLWNGLTTLLGIALIPLAHVIKFLAKGITWLLDKINSLLDSIGLGGGSKAATAEAGSSAGEAASGEAADGGGGALSTKKAEGATVDAMNTQPVKTVEKNLAQTSANLPDNKKLMSNILSIFGWLAGFSAAIALFAVLSAYFNLTVGQVVRVAIISGAALVALIAAVAVLTYLLAMSFKLLSDSIDFLDKTWSGLNMWSQLWKFAGLGLEMMLWATAFAIGLIVFAVFGAALFYLAGELLVVGLIVGLGFGLFLLAVALMNVIIAGGLMAAVWSMNFLTETINGLGIWAALGTYMASLFQLLAWITLLGAGLIIWGVVGAVLLIFGYEFLALAGIVGLCLGVLLLGVALMNLILAVGLMAAVWSMNFFSQQVNGLDIWGALGTYMAALYQLLAWITVLGAGLIVWGVVGAVLLYFGGEFLLLAGVVGLAFSVLLLGVALMSLILAVSLQAAVWSMNYFSQTVFGMDIWGSLGTYMAALYNLLAWITVLGAGLIVWGVVGAVLLFFGGEFLALAGIVGLCFAVLLLALTVMNLILAESLSAAVWSMNYFSEAVIGGDIWGALGTYIASLYSFLSWLTVLGGALVVWGVVGAYMLWYGAWIFGLAAIVAIGFALINLSLAWMANILASSIWRMVAGFQRLDDAVAELPKISDIWTTMLALYKWMKDMQILMTYLDMVSLSLAQYGFYWYYVGTNFSDRFNNAIRGISTAFLSIDIGAALRIEQHLDFVDDLPDTAEIKQRMYVFFDWMKAMQALMTDLDSKSTLLEQYGLWWWLTGQKFTNRFNNAIWGIGRSFTGIDKGAVLSIEPHLSFVDSLPQPKDITATMNRLFRWMQDMQAAMIELDRISQEVKALYDAWQAAPGNFKIYFNEALGGIGRHFTGIDKQAVESIEPHLAFVDKLPEPNYIKSTMQNLYNWLHAMTNTMTELDALSVQVKVLYDAWQRAPGNFRVYFNEAIQGIGAQFTGIDVGAVTNIQSTMDRIEDAMKAADPATVRTTLINLKWWLYDMSDVLAYMNWSLMNVWKTMSKNIAKGREFGWMMYYLMSSIRSIFNNLTTEMLQGLGGAWKSDVLDGLPKPSEILQTYYDVGWYMRRVCELFPHMAEDAKSLQKITRTQRRDGGKFIEAFNTVANGVRDILSNMTTDMLKNLGGGWDSSVVNKLPSTFQIMTTYNNVRDYMQRVCAMFPLMADDARRVQQETRTGRAAGQRFLDAYNDVALGVRHVLFHMSTDMLRNLGGNWNGNVVNQLPPPIKIMSTYNQVRDYMTKVIALFPLMADDARRVQQETRSGRAAGQRFLDAYNDVANSVRTIMSGMTTDMLRNLGGNWNARVVDRLPTPDDILRTFEEVKNYLKGVSAIFPQLATQARTLQQDTAYGRSVGGRFITAFTDVVNGVKGVMDQMNTTLLNGLGRNWRANVVSQLPSPDRIMDTWNNADPRRGVKAYLIAVSALMPALHHDAYWIQGQVNEWLALGKQFSIYLDGMLGSIREVFSKMNTGLLRGLGGRWDANIVSKLPTAFEIQDTWGNADPKKGVKAYLISIAQIMPALHHDSFWMHGQVNEWLNLGKQFGTHLQGMLENIRLVFSNMNTGLLRGIGGRWNANIISKLPSPAQIMATWNDPDPKKGIKAYLVSIAQMFPALEADINTWKDTITNELAAGRRFGTALSRVMEQTTGVFRLINTTVLRNMGPFGTDVKRGIVSQLPTPDQIANAIAALESWLNNTANVIARTLPPMVTRLESTLTPRIIGTGQDSAEALQRMIMAVGGIFRRISVVNLKGAFAGFSKKTVDSLPNPDELLTTFAALEAWMKSLAERVLPKLQQLTTDLRAALEGQLNRGVEISREFGSMVQKIANIFTNIRLTQLSTAVRGFVRSWGRGLPPAAELSGIMDQLVNWMKDIFGAGGPMKMMEEAMTTGPLAGINEIATAIREHAAAMGAAMDSIAQTFRAIDPTRAVRAIERLQRFGSGGRALPNREQIMAAVGQVRSFVTDASAAFQVGTERALGTGQAGATGFVATAPINADPTGTTPGRAGAIQPVRPGQSQSAVQTNIGQRLAGAEPPASMNAANQQLGEIAANTRQMAQQQQQTNAILTAVLAAVSGSGGGGSGGSAARSGENVQPTSTPLFPRLAFNYNGGTQKRYVQTGST